MTRISAAAVNPETRLFLVGDDDHVQLLDHDRYVRLARRETTAPEFAERRFILVDWYLRIAGSQAQDVVNESCSWVVFDAQGRLNLKAAHEIEAPAAPGETQWAQVRRIIFAAPCQRSKRRF